jgi:transcriptional regulator of acetoin/glycerol metabolism
MVCLAAHRWPGNIRELIHVAEHVVLLCANDQIAPIDLPEEVRHVLQARTTQWMINSVAFVMELRSGRLPMSITRLV